MNEFVYVCRSRPGKQVNLSEQEVRTLCIKARDIFINQPILLELEAPIKICGNYRAKLGKAIRLTKSLNRAFSDKILSNFR